MYYIKMPYEIRKVGGGFLVCDKKRCYSGKPLTKKKAKKQQIALAISSAEKENKPVGSFFV
jgi:hypothetical protein